MNSLNSALLDSNVSSVSGHLPVYRSNTLMLAAKLNLHASIS